MIEMTIRLLPQCGHETHEPTCMWCKDLHRVARELLKDAQRHPSEGLHTRVVITAYNDTTKPYPHIRKEPE